MMQRATNCLLAVFLVLGCASTRVTERNEYQGAKLPRPGRIIVHDFAVTQADLPSWSEAHAHFAGAATEQTDEALELGRNLGAAVAKELVEQIDAMGLPAVRATSQAVPRQDDLVLVGYFASVDEGSRLKRIVIGFGSGGADLKTHVEGYRMTQGRFEKLGSGNLDSGPSKGPGVVVPAIVTIATANPIGLVVGGAVKAAGELTGSSTIEGSAKRTAEKIADLLEPKFEEQGWL